VSYPVYKEAQKLIFRTENTIDRDGYVQHNEISAKSATLLLRSTALCTIMSVN